MNMLCPTCGSETKVYRHNNSAYDADVPFKNRPVSKEVSYESSYEEGANGVWYCGPCPDAWHDSIPECPISDCSVHGKHSHEFVHRG